MSKDNENRDGEEPVKPRIVVEDKRFSRESEDDDGVAETDEAPVAAKPEGETAPVDGHSAESKVEHAPHKDAKEHGGKKARDHFEVIQEAHPEETGENEFDQEIEEEMRQAFKDMTPEDEERLKSAAREQFAQLSRVGIENYLREALNVAYLLSLQYLGLQPNPETNLTAPDLERAGVCIDVIEFLGLRLADFLKAEEQNQIIGLAAALKMEFAKLASPGKQPEA